MLPPRALLIDNGGVPAKRSPSTLVYQLKITLQDIRPPIWRRVRVPARVRLNCLHDVFQIVMGWTDSHLHQFEKDGACYGVPYDEFEEVYKEKCKKPEGKNDRKLSDYLLGA